MLKKLFTTSDDIGLLIARITLGVVIFPHGAQKILGIWGGSGMEALATNFEAWFGIPPFISYLVAIAEFFGSLALIFGFMSRFSAASIIAVMLGAIYFVVGNHFFMNWYSEQGRGEGFEFHLLAIGLALIIVIKGAGKFSLDGFIVNKFFQKDESNE